MIEIHLKNQNLPAENATKMPLKRVPAASDALNVSFFWTHDKGQLMTTHYNENYIFYLKKWYFLSLRWWFTSLEIVHKLVNIAQK